MGRALLIPLTAVALLTCTPREIASPAPTPPEPDTTIVEPPRPLPPPNHVRVSTLVLNNLAWSYFWADGQTEFAGCLEGWQSADTVYVARYYPALIFKAGPGSIEYECLDTPGLIGFVHSHTTRDPDLDQRCSFSPVDKLDIQRRFSLVESLRVEMLVCAHDRYFVQLRGGLAWVRTMPPVAPLPPNDTAR